MNQQVKDLMEAVRNILPRFEFDDGVATTSTLDIEMLERAYHAVDARYAPSRPDSAVCPCIHNCRWCREHDLPSGESQFPILQKRYGFKITQVHQPNGITYWDVTLLLRNGAMYYMQNITKEALEQQVVNYVKQNREFIVKYPSGEYDADNS